MRLALICSSWSIARTLMLTARSRITLSPNRLEEWSVLGLENSSTPRSRRTRRQLSVCAAIGAGGASGYLLRR